MLAYVAGGGAEGIVEPGGLRVAPLATPGGSVRVLPGAGLVLNRYPGGSQQAYAIQETTQATVPITPTGSGGGRTDLIVARVRDEQYGAGPSGVTFEAIQGVPAGSGAAYVQALPYPALALARVTLPASTATVQAAHITNLRTLARPRVQRRVFQGVPTPGVNLTSSAGVQWPSYRPTVQVPAWATHAIVLVQLNSLWHQGAAVSGRIHLTLGSGAARWSEDQPYHYDDTVGGGEHVSLSYGIEVEVPAAMRGASQVLGIEAGRNAGTGYLSTRAGTRVIYDIQFEERAV